MRKFKKGDIVRYTGEKWAVWGTRARVEGYSDPGFGVFLEIVWIDPARGSNGGYYEQDFELLTPRKKLQLKKIKL